MRSSRTISTSDRHAICTTVAPVVNGSRARIHSPEPSPTRHTVAKALHKSHVLGVTFPTATMRNRRKALRTHGNDSMRRVARPCGKYRMKFRNDPARGILMWCGPVLFEATANGWRVLDVVEPSQRVRIGFFNPQGCPCEHIAVFNRPQTFNGPMVKGRMSFCDVQPLKACYRKVCDTHEQIVEHWAPFTRLIYAKCNDLAGSRVFARIDSANTIHCLHCSEHFANVKQLCHHMHLPTSVEFKTEYTGTHHDDADPA